VRNNTDCALDEIRWKIVKAMLDEFPQLAQRSKNVLQPKEATFIVFRRFVLTVMS
jgi:heme oxygenase